MRYVLPIQLLACPGIVAFGVKSETEETIARCLRDLKSEDVESRRRAATSPKLQDSRGNSRL